MVQSMKDAPIRGHLLSKLASSVPPMKSVAQQSVEYARSRSETTRSGEFLAVRPRDPDLPIAWTESQNAVCDTVSIVPRGLALAAGEGSGCVHLVDGEVAWVTADVELGVQSFTERLVASELVSAAELDLVFALCRVEGLHVCAALQRLALVEPAALRAAVRDHMRDTLSALLAQPDLTASWTQSHLAFDENLTVAMGEVLPTRGRSQFRELCIQSGGAPARAHDDARIPLRRTANVETVHGAVMMTTVDFSMAGARLRAKSLLPIASRVVVHLNIAGERLELPGRVVRFDRGTGKELPSIVVLWTELPAETESKLSRVWSALY